MPILDRRKDRFVEDQDSRVSVGIDFPFGRVPNSGDGYFQTSKTTVESIKNNIKLLLQTERGDRVFQPLLGMNLRSFLFEQITEDTRVQIENNIVGVFGVILLIKHDEFSVLDINSPVEMGFAVRRFLLPASCSFLTLSCFSIASLSAACI